MDIEPKLRGYLWGSACGDALGMPVEFWPREAILSKYGEHGIQNIPNNGLWTDDTQMMLAIAKALIRGSNRKLEELMQIVTEEYVDWLKDPGIAPGNTCTAGVERLREGIHWTKSGITNSKGCGSVMRSGIIGYVYQNDVEKLKKVASATGIATHGHLAADAACIAGALAVKFAFDGYEPIEMYDPIIREIKGISSEFDEKMIQVMKLVDSKLDYNIAISKLGEGWVGDEAFAMAYFTTLVYPNDYLSAVRLGVNITGDSDSIGCIAGGIMGARLGISAIPDKWLDNLSEGHRLEEIVPHLLGLRI